MKNRLRIRRFFPAYLLTRNLHFESLIAFRFKFFTVLHWEILKYSIEKSYMAVESERCIYSAFHWRLRMSNAFTATLSVSDGIFLERISLGKFYFKPKSTFQQQLMPIIHSVQLQQIIKILGTWLISTYEFSDLYFACMNFPFILHRFDCIDLNASKQNVE